MKRLILAAILLALSALSAAPALAHAVLLGTTPADREVLAASPDAIVLRFNEQVQPISLRLLDQSGAPAASAAAIEASDGEIRLVLPEPLPDGAYMLSYRITSADSHPLGGAILFAIGAEPATWRAAPGAGDNPVWSAANAVNRALHLAGFLGLAGGIAFLLLFPGERLAVRRALAPLLGGCAALAIVTATLTFGLHGALLANAAPVDLLAGATWRLGWNSTRGTAALMALCAAIVLVAASRLGGDKARQGWFSPLALTGLAFSVLAFTLSGHAATAQPRWLTVPALAAHVAVAGLWLGSLAPLLKGLRRLNKGTAPRLADFSRAMSWALPVLLLGGAVLAVVQLQSFGAFAETRYGALLLFKLLLAAALLGFAARNKFRLLPALRQGRAGAETAIAAAVRWEIALGLAILTVTALMSQTVPPRSIGAHDGHDHADRFEGYSTVVTARGRMALINVDPAVAGRNSVELRFATAEGRPFSPIEATVAFSNEAAGIEGLTRRLERIGDGHYRMSGPEFALPGAWRLQVDALISDYEKIDFVAAIPIAR